MIRLCYLFTLLLFLLPSAVRSQEIIGSSGDFFPFSNGSIAFTIGEPLVETAVLPNGILTQGFQQTYPSTSSLMELEIEQPYFYPNPAAESIELVIPEGTLYEQLFVLDASGKQIQTLELNKLTHQQIDIRQLSNGCYFLFVSAEKKETHYLGILTKY
jgi:hypothetical protein